MSQAIVPDTLRRILRVQGITVAWMSAEAAVSLFAAWRAQSPALLAFGGDSTIELISAVVVLWRFRANGAQEHEEHLASRIAGGLLFALAACVVATSTMVIVGYAEPRPTLLGIGILIAAAVFMPLLAREKRRLSSETSSAALKADAAESALCGYLSLIALLGLLVSRLWKIRLADPTAALLTIPIMLREGWEAIRGKPCACE